MAYCEIVEACMLHTPVSLGALSLIMVCDALLICHKLVMKINTTFNWMKGGFSVKSGQDNHDKCGNNTYDLWRATPHMNRITIKKYLIQKGK